MDDPEDDSKWVKEHDIEYGCRRTTICYYRVEDNGYKDLRRTVHSYRLYPHGYGYEFGVCVWPRCFDEVDVLYEPVQTISRLPPLFLDKEDINFLTRVNE